MRDVEITPQAIVIGLGGILVLGLFGYLTFAPKPAPPAPPVLTAEAKQYLPNLALGNVRMQASESVINQRVVEILGEITNNGTRTVKLAEVTCVFRDYSANEILRERVPIVGDAASSGVGGGPLKPGQTQQFRLPFDDVANTWNQAMPTLVIAQIQFQ